MRVYDGWEARRLLLAGTLPRGSVIKGFVDLRGSGNLATLPDDLTVDGTLHLGDCSALILLPRRLTIGRMLNLAGCSGLTGPPPSQWRAFSLNFSSVYFFSYRAGLR
jgi:hypothetical protein